MDGRSKPLEFQVSGSQVLERNTVFFFFCSTCQTGAARLTDTITRKENMRRKREKENEGRKREKDKRKLKKETREENGKNDETKQEKEEVRRKYEKIMEKVSDIEIFCY